MVRYRITGVSSAFGGAQWERKDDDGEIARRVLNLLGDHRMLWQDYSMEIQEHCVESADRARRELGAHLDNPEIGKELARRVQGLQKLFRDFMDEVGPHGQDWDRPRQPYGTDPLSMALGRLRGCAGVQVGELAALYDLQVTDELATSVPDGSAWFFERFEGEEG
jgi:hypothetical protein